MPFLIRIILQRSLIFFLSFLAFLGINPDINIPTIEEVNQNQEVQKEIVKEALSKTVGENQATEKLNKIQTKVDNIIKQVSETQTQAQKTVENAINIPNIKSTETGIAVEGDFIDNVVVNIVCVNRNANLISLTTGSGVIVSPSGIVLTNSHVANSFLFDDKGSPKYKECSIRRENIPTYGFNAKLVYLPGDWLIANQSFFTESVPRGSGEDDYALLAITSNTNPVLSLPNNFQYVDTLKYEDPIDRGLAILVAAYPGVHTGVFEVDSNAKLKTAESSIADLITLDGDTIDLISSSPNIVAKRGSSGGGVFWKNSLLGLITTTDGTGSDTYLNALTLPYIIRDFKKDTNTDFESFISRDKKSLISDFQQNEDYLKGLIANFL